jgi:hypothetical protein
VALIVAVVMAVTADVVDVKLAVVLPAVTVTDAGVPTEELSSERLTTMPPVGAGAVKVTVPVDEVPAITLFGFIDKLASAAVGFTVRVEVLLRPL